jgi:hypothetical protein
MGNTQTPTEYADERIARARRHANGELGVLMRAFVPMAFEGAPWEAFLGFAMNGSQRENTTQCDREICRRQRFHEVGFLGSPAGLASGPAPNPDPDAPYNTWGKEACSDLVREMLGRCATMEPDGWKEAVADQVAVGLADLRGKYAYMRRLIADPSVDPSAPGTPWGTALAFGGWSSGLIAHTVNDHAAGLRGVPERARFGRLVQLVNAETARGIYRGDPGAYNNPAYQLLRTWQKLELGRRVAAEFGGDASWFDLGLGDGARRLEAERLLERGATHGSPLALVTAGGAGRKVALGAAALAVAAAAVYVARKGGPRKAWKAAGRDLRRAGRSLQRLG